MLEGVLTVFFEETDGLRDSTKLKKWEVISCPAGILHGFHNDGNEDDYMQTYVGSGRPGPVGYVDDNVYDNVYEEEQKRLASRQTVTEVRVEDGLILLITGDVKGPHGEFWLEPDEQIAVIRYPETATGTTPAKNANARHKHS